MFVKEVMSKPAISIDQKGTVFDASMIYKEKHVGCLIVTDNGDVVGILTERDIIERSICLDKNPRDTKVKEIMTEDVTVIQELDTLQRASDVMMKNRIKKLPVVKDDAVVGIITASDIVRVLPKLSDQLYDLWLDSAWVD
jgi:CBS domain-containing protein